MESDQDQTAAYSQERYHGPLVPLLGFLITTAIFLWAKEVLLPIAVALILTAFLSPIVRRLERYIGSLASAALVVIAAVVLLFGIFYFVTTELTSVAANVASYSSTIAHKIENLEHSKPQWLQRVEHGVQNVQSQLQKGQTGKAQNKVQAVSDSSHQQFLSAAIPVFTGTILALFTIVLLFFFLYSRQDLRDRLVRLAARAGIPIAAQALDTAGFTVSHYLLLFALINLGYGVSTGLVLWMLGMPQPELWGMLGFLLRFIPYLGAASSALMPTAVAFAIFPGWSMAIGVLLTYIVIDQISAQLIEPFVIGRGIGIAPVVLLISAAYWTWVWGPVGLLIATPLTACCKVAGDYIPGLDFLSLLLGAHERVEDFHDFYIKLLEQNRAEVDAVAIRHCNQHGLEETFETLFKPSIEEAGQELEEARPLQQFVFESIRDLITELGDRYSKTRSSVRLRLIGCSAPGDPHNLGLLMVLELMRREGCAASFAGENKTADEIRDLVLRFAPDLICLSCTLDQSIESASALIKMLVQESARITIIAGGQSALTHARDLLAAGAARVCRDANEARRIARQLQSRNPRSRGAESGRSDQVAAES